MKLLGLADQQNRRIVVKNIDDFKTDVWQWSVDDEKFKNISGLKLRNTKEYGTVAAFCASEGYAAVAKYPEGDILWQVYAEGNLHSIEVLPNFKIALAASDGCYIRLYEGKEYQEVNLPQAHGALWDPENECLWALGEYELRAYKNGLNREAAYNLPEGISDGHDLSPDYNDKNELFITTHQSVFKFCKKEKEFKAYMEMPCVKGIGNFPKGEIAYIYPNGKHLPWCTDEVHIGDRIEKVNNEAYYKLRIWNERYI